MSLRFPIWRLPNKRWPLLRCEQTAKAVIPGLAGDQPFVAAAVQERGAGRALPGDASTDAMRAGAQEVLSTPSFRRIATEKSVLLAGIDGTGTPPTKLKRCSLRRRNKQISRARGHITVDASRLRDGTTRGWALILSTLARTLGGQGKIL
jgi:hypothetical protein